jgi:hypothetical protein
MKYVYLIALHQSYLFSFLRSAFNSPPTTIQFILFVELLDTAKSQFQASTEAIKTY